jgi:hypothetical protein
MVIALVPVLVSCTLWVEFVPTSTVPKLSELGARVSEDGLETATTEMNSSDVLALEETSMELTRIPLPDPCCVELCGVNVTVSVQLAPGTIVAQLLVDTV